jgi:hypothetical protein
MVPNLLNAVDVYVEQLSTSTTIYDDDFREPVQQVDHAQVKHLRGQVQWLDADDLKVTPVGNEENATGYVVFRYVDLETQSVALKINDRITKLGNQTTDLYIIKLTPCGHWADQGGATMVKAYFADRQPSRQNA